MNSGRHRTIAIVIACAGMVLYGLMAFGVLMPLDHPYYGTDLYNAYYYRLQDGRFDLPMRMLRFEGHYTADGTAIMYHGMAPLLTRVLLDPFVTLHVFPTAAFSVWLWAVMGSAFYHLAAHQVLQRFAGGATVFWSVVVGIAVWVCGPGLLTSANPVLYHEPIAIAYAAFAIAVYLMLRVTLFGMPLTRAIIPLALLAAVLIHSRPHLAVGLYAAIVALIGLAILRKEAGAILRGGVGLVLLGAVALSFLQLNAIRFGSAAVAHGGFSEELTADAVEIGMVYFGTDYAVTGPGVAFREHGTFNPWRVVPNLIVYSFDFPVIKDQMAAFLKASTEPFAGYGGVEAPRFGMVFLWPIWIALMCAGLAKARPRVSGGIAAAPVLLATGITAVLMLAYPTLAFRYRFELWPLVFVLGLLAVPALMQRYSAEVLGNARLRQFVLILLFAGVATSARVAIPYMQSYEAAPGRFYAAWDAATCKAMIAHHAYPDDVATALCIAPESVFEGH